MNILQIPSKENSAHKKLSAWIYQTEARSPRCLIRAGQVGKYNLFMLLGDRSL